MLRMSMNKPNLAMILALLLVHSPIYSAILVTRFYSPIDDDEGGSSNTGAIIGATLGALAVLLLVAILLFFIWRAKYRKPGHK